MVNKSLPSKVKDFFQNALFYKQMYACVSEVFESASTGWIDGYVCIAWTPISNLVITGQESSVTQGKEIDVLDWR